MGVGALSMRYPPMLFVNKRHAWQHVMILTCKVMIINERRNIRPEETEISNLSTVSPLTLKAIFTDFLSQK